MWLYNFGLTLYVWLIRLVAPRHPKARLWIDGRKDLYKRMAETIDPTDRIVWVHVASLGEFEQGRPIIERIRKTHPEYKILLTFFSPSGYEVRKNYQGVDYIFYLPIDTPRNARRFLDAAHPEIAIFVKYEFCFSGTFIVLLCCSAINKAVFFIQFLCWHISSDRVQPHCLFLFVCSQLDDFIKCYCCRSISLIFR